MSSEATFASVKTRLRKKRIGSIGASARSSQRTNSARTTAPATSAPTISGDVHPWPVAGDGPPDDAEGPAAREREARQFELVRRAVGLVEPHQCQRDQGDADR